MPYEFRMPNVASNGIEGFVVNWFKDEGQPVQADELLLEVQFEKVVVEIQAPVSGILTKILCPQGHVVKVGQPLCLIEEEATEVAGGSESATPPVYAPEETTHIHGETEQRSQSTPVDTQDPGNRTGDVRATPAARKLARELGISLEAIPGTGPGGRITEEDVKKFAQRSEKTDLKVKRVPLTPTQRLVGARMLQSLRETAQFTLGREIDVSALIKVRMELRQKGSPANMTDLIHKAVVQAILENPEIQAIIDGNDMILPAEVHLGFAVARGDELLVPVIKNAHRLSLNEMAVERRRLTDAVLQGIIKPEELQGGTFTITNLGTYGIDFFTPVLYPKQSAILGIGRIVERPVLENGNVRSAQFMTLSLTVDHQVINGAPAARFLTRLAELLSQPEALLES
ncbi:Pyruvate/2-oxoglutarate dehydrogenase complex, dihydrolipoamide acyltransferase component [Thermoanaerobacter thermohydrosulfuricus WC1]|uniref:Dihydrolipoamide acetyltransferase component of pyruvate dehydrogenase complex n=1 Tax=Thermoanaerobacter thermohydrosulfuricus WC1 TaxID=1198630 RepID=M8CP49_THETY|nr:dihydrolipoamide acetyltransferase family protein [Thermoanaerobacter indiensis]EMT38925.1 Pyruvate/2-oxoglutarate dehydrogenase complex, dihydrolipoamide acyltransferase component [Thermoanaerobacter thermohydrosulfuricus WC1]